jgi:3-hydroxyacyl-CoA dehydrogenase
LLDLKSDDPKRPNKIVEDALKKISKMKPAPFGMPEFVHRIKTGNFEDDFDALKDADWICEVIIERMDIKQQMMQKIDQIRSAHTIVSSNTSGLPISEISASCSTGFQKMFLGTHFFNPPRYMKLLELIPTDCTDEKVTDMMRTFAQKVLGKGVVECEDTPNFIANRIGVFSIASIMPHYFKGDFRVEEIDKLTGTLTGYSKAATFRTGDMAGLDIIKHVSENLYPAIPNDEQREVFNLPDTFKAMVESGIKGNKSGGGFYKKVQTKSGRAFHVYNAEAGEYEPQQDFENETVAEAAKIKDLGARLRFLCNKEDRIGSFVWEVQRDLLLYAANRMGEITDSISAVDRAMKWGFNWEIGPFERWDALGGEKVVEKLKAENIEIPAVVTQLLDAVYTSFYNNGKVFDPLKGVMMKQPAFAEGQLSLSEIIENKNPVLQNDSAALHDAGDGVAIFEFKTKNATLGFELVSTLEKSLSIVEDQFEALILYHDGDSFAYGANLMEAVSALKQGDHQAVKDAVDTFQRTALKLRYAPFPVVAAPFGKTLGGGTEFVLYSDRTVAHYELYMGLVEVGVGLIPAGGGTTELLKRAMKKVESEADPLPYVREVFKTIGLAQVSDSAHKAKDLGFLRDEDVIVMNRDLLLATAKSEAIAMINSGYQPPAKVPVKVQGTKALSVMDTMLYIMYEAGYATDYDKVMSRRVAEILAGGPLSEPQHVDEEHLLTMERNAIMKCFGDERTHQRIEHMLTKGKPLRN